MKQITKDNLKDLEFNGIVVGLPSYVEIDQHKDLIFITIDDKQTFLILYNNNYLPKGLTVTKESKLEKCFKFNSYDYYQFENMIEFCTWYLQKQNKSIPTEPLIEEKKLKRGDRLKEVREYVKQVLSIEYYKNFAVFKNHGDKVMKELSQKMAENLKQDLVNWLEEEI